MRTLFVRGFNNYDADLVSEETGLACLDPSRALQSQAEEADINTIVKRFGVTGMLPQRIPVPPIEEFAEVFDYRSAQDLLIAANKSFSALPADVRAKFANDPASFVDFCSDPDNLDAMREMGLAVPAAVVDTPVVPVNPE